MRNNPLWAVFLVCVPLSLLSIGGGASILAPLNRQAVEVQHWLTQREFVDLFAISRAAPGPGSMLVALIGWKVAGWAGALVAVIGTFLPSSLLCYGAAKAWNRYRGTRFHTALENGLVPVGTGLFLAGAAAILRASGAGPLGWSVAAGSAALLACRDVHPLLVLFGGGVAYAVGVAFGG